MWKRKGDEMAEKGTGTAKAAERYTTEQLKQQMGIGDAVHSGTCARMNWCRGKEITEKEYTAAVEKFKAAAAGRRRNA